MGLEQGLTHVYTGNGKGKTSAALGLALRASGRGLRVLLVHVSLSKVAGVTQVRFGTDHFVDPKNPDVADKEAAQVALAFLGSGVWAGERR